MSATVFSAAEFRAPVYDRYHAIIRSPSNVKQLSSCTARPKFFCRCMQSV